MHDATLDRRHFLQRLGAGAAALGLASQGHLRGQDAAPEPPFRISLAGWSLHRRHFQEQALPLTDFPRVSREEFGIGAIELVNTMFPSPTYRTLQKLLAECERHDVKVLLVMCDGEGNLSAESAAERAQAVRNHHKWVDITAVLGGHSIRVNTGGAAGVIEDVRRCAESLRALAEYAGTQDIQVLVENHGGLSSHPASLVQLMEETAMPNVGTLPDFGNFPREVDRYAAVQAMMPFARAVSAKCHDFDAEGNETGTDYERMLRIVQDAGYRGYVGIEYEGQRLSEHDGILACRRLLEKVAQKLATG